MGCINSKCIQKKRKGQYESSEQALTQNRTELTSPNRETTRSDQKPSYVVYNQATVKENELAKVQTRDMEQENDIPSLASVQRSKPNDQPASTTDMQPKECGSGESSPPLPARNNDPPAAGSSESQPSRKGETSSEYHTISDKEAFATKRHSDQGSSLNFSSSYPSKLSGDHVYQPQFPSFSPSVSGEFQFQNRPSDAASKSSTDQMYQIQSFTSPSISRDAHQTRSRPSFASSNPSKHTDPLFQVQSFPSSINSQAQPSNLDYSSSSNGGNTVSIEPLFQIQSFTPSSVSQEQPQQPRQRQIHTGIVFDTQPRSRDLLMMCATRQQNTSALTLQSNMSIADSEVGTPNVLVQNPYPSSGHCTWRLLHDPGSARQHQPDANPSSSAKFLVE